MLGLKLSKKDCKVNSSELIVMMSSRVLVNANPVILVIKFDINTETMKGEYEYSYTLQNHIHC